MISATRLSCHRGVRLLLQGVSLSVAGGEVLWLTGPNGVGKSTLLRILAGLQKPLDGEVQVNVPFTYLGAELGFDPSLTLVDNLRWFAALNNSGDIQTAVEQVALTNCLNLPFQNLSKGQQQRAALARLLLAARPLWILDEPLAHLDAAGRQLVTKLIETHLANGGAIIAATHDVPDIKGGRVLPLEVAA